MGISPIAHQSESNVIKETHPTRTNHVECDQMRAILVLPLVGNKRAWEKSDCKLGHQSIQLVFLLNNLYFDICLDAVPFHMIRLLFFFLRQRLYLVTGDSVVPTITTENRTGKLFANEKSRETKAQNKNQNVVAWQRKKRIRELGRTHTHTHMAERNEWRKAMNTAYCSAPFSCSGLFSRYCNTLEAMLFCCESIVKHLNGKRRAWLNI